ncbi:MAG TPA: hypothetical protein VNC50_13130 [Planctomycetia bacterium]|nr:hypothetical protein [Planctomycetia bacterium]
MSVGARGRFPWLAVAAILALDAAALSHRAGRTWIGDHDWNGAAWSTAARNILRRPLSETHAGVALAHGSRPLEREDFYVHHPPLVVWLMSGAYAALGESEAVGRSVPVVFSLASAALVAGIAFRIGGRTAAWLAPAIFTSFAANLYYGRMPNHEPVAQTWMLAATLAFLHWRDGPTPGKALAAAPWLVAGCWSGWPGYLFAAASGLVSLRDRGRSWLFVVGLASTATLIAFFAHIRLVRADAIGDLLAAFGLRSGTVTLAGWYGSIDGAIDRLIAPGGLAAALAASVFAFSRFGDRALVPLLAAGIGNVVLFRQGAFVHEYYCYYLAAPLSLAAALGVARLTTVASAGGWWFALLVLALATRGGREALRLHEKQSNLYATGRAENEDFVERLGAAIAAEFPPDAVILTDALPIGEHLGYYADRRIVYLSELPAERRKDWIKRATGAVLLDGSAGGEEVLKAAQSEGGKVVSGGGWTGVGPYRIRFARFAP